SVPPSGTPADRPPSLIERRLMNKEDLLAWCAVPVDGLEGHPGRRVPLRIVEDSPAMGRLMAQELVDAVLEATSDGRTLRAIIPCGPRSWYGPFAELVNARRISLAGLEVF